MADDTVPSLSPDDDKTPNERPRSKAKRVAATDAKASVVFDGRPLVIEPLKVPAFSHEEKIKLVHPYARWRVLEDKEYPLGPSTALVHCGDILSEQNFDIPKLQRMGVRLEKVEE
jgi:hypothetical protein